MGGKNLFIGNRTLSRSLLRNQRDFLIGLHYETESKLCPPNKSFLSWLIRAHSSGRMFLLLFSADGAKAVPLMPAGIEHDGKWHRCPRQTRGAGRGGLSAPAGHGRGTGNVPRISRFASKNGN